jgi:hypothetical protein
MALTIGSQLGFYKVTELLGAGGMAKSIEQETQSSDAT